MNSKREHKLLKVIRCPYGDENGVILMVVLIFVGILALVGATATIITTTDTKIGANYKTAEKALYVAEAGAHEARERMRPSSAYPITDWHTDKYQWTAFIGTDPKTQKKGYDSNNSMHVKVASLQTDIDYTVVITHQLDTADPTKVLYWGDDDPKDGTWTRNTTTGENIYLITSYGTAEGSTKTVQLEVTRVPPITVNAALYTGTSATIQGSVSVNGNDFCDETSSPLPGIATPQTAESLPITVGGTPASVTGDEAYGDPSVKYSEPQALDVQSMADFLKKCADFSYSVSSATHTASTTPGPGDGWGTPDLAVPTCDSCNIVYYDTDGTSISLSGNVSGCGILVVEGDLNLSGGFEWYGTVIVTGAFTFTGGAGSKNIMGAVISGESTDGDFVGGNVDINYCSTATEDQNEKHALPILSWIEVLAE